MTILILFFASLTLIAGVIIVIDPEIIFGYLRKYLESLSLHVMAVVVRLVIGVLLITQSGVSKFPLVIEVIGWMSIAAALVFSVIGRHNFKRLMSWALSLLKPFARAGGFMAVLFGAFLIYAFV